jgi:hypothetical protein
MTTVSSLYDTNFYSDQQDGSLSSARVVVPLVLSIFDVRSVVDIGCGVGGWLKVFQENGVHDCLGIDGDYVPREMLKISPGCFRAADLTRLEGLGRRFDLACSLEVAEHLPASSASAFVDALVRAAPVILFSAAVPHQGGTDHVNERWQSYWRRMFEARGYAAVDCVRPRIVGNGKVDPWYRQNIVIYCRPEMVPAGYGPSPAGALFDWIDPEMYERLMRPDTPTGKEAAQTILRMLPIVGRAALRKIGLG